MSPGSRASAHTGSGLATSRARGALAGAVAAGAALAAGELPTALAGRQVSLVTAVGNEFVDRYAASLKDLAVALFGEDDKIALITGIVVTCLGLGAAAGALAPHRRNVVAAVFGLFGLVGWYSMVTDPGSSSVLAVASALAAVAAGVAVLVVLLPGGSTAPITEADGHGDIDDPRVKTPDRRSFLVLAGSIGVAAAAVGTAGRALRLGSTVDAERAAIVLPPPASSTSVPGGAPVSVEGVSSYITPNRQFFRIDTALVTPQVDPDSWRLGVTGLVEQPFEVTFDELLAMDLIEEPVTIACVSNEVGGDLIGNAAWLGVPLARLLERAGVRPEATQVVGRSVDGFTTGFPTEHALDGRVAMVAVGMNGEPLPAAHGFPARLVVSGLYGYVSATKWLSEIELTRWEDFDAYWVPRGWSKRGPVKTQSRIDVPRAGTTVPAGPLAVGGVAWAPGVGVSRVEVRLDGGEWQTAALGEVASDHTWVQWSHRVETRPGAHTLQVRATDATGTTQTVEATGPRPDGATGYHTVDIEAAA